MPVFRDARKGTASSGDPAQSAPHADAIDPVKLYCANTRVRSR